MAAQEDAGPAKRSRAPAAKGFPSAALLPVPTMLLSLPSHYHPGKAPLLSQS